MFYRTYRKGFKIEEIPIIFYDRDSGSSKMDKKVIHEVAMMFWRFRLGG